MVFVIARCCRLGSRVVSVLDSGADAPGVQIASATLRQTVHTHRTSVHQAAELVAALLRVARVTSGLAESNGSLPLGLRLTSRAGWLPRTGISSGTLRAVIEYGLPLPLDIDASCRVGSPSRRWTGRPVGSWKNQTRTPMTSSRLEEAEEQVLWAVWTICRRRASSCRTCLPCASTWCARRQSRLRLATYRRPLGPTTRSNTASGSASSRCSTPPTWCALSFRCWTCRNDRKTTCRRGLTRGLQCAALLVINTLGDSDVIL